MKGPNKTTRWGVLKLNVERNGHNINVQKFEINDPTGPSGELNRKLKGEWEAIRHSESYRRDRDSAFQKFVERVKQDFESPQDFHREWPLERLEFEFKFSPFPGEGLKTARKYGLQMPWHYDDPLWDPDNNGLPPVFLNPMAVEVIPHGKPAFKKLGKNESILDLTPHLQDRRFLTLKIDLYKPKTQIQWEVDYQVEKYVSLADIPKTGKPGKRGPKIDHYVKGSDPKVSIYKVWQMNKKEFKGAWKIAKEIWPHLEGKSPNDYHENYNPQAKKLLKRIEDAIKKADFLISSVKPTSL